MVIACQKCRTRFQLDEARIPAKGARVRCSRCKHAFLVLPPGDQDETVHRIAAEAAASPGARQVPEATADLPPRGEPRAGRGGPGEESEDDWQFNIEPPGDAGGDAPLAAAPDDPAPEVRDAAAPAAGPEEQAAPGDLDSLFELGGLSDPQDPAVADAEITDSDPTAFGTAEGDADLAGPADVAATAGNADGWELAPEEDEAAPVRAPSAPPRAAARPARASSEAAGSAAATAPARERSAAPSATAVRIGGARETGARSAQPQPLGRAAAAAGWAAAAAIFAVGLLGALRPAPAARELPPATVGALELGALRARYLDNYWSGPVLVIQGELRNPGSGPAFLGGAPQARLTETPGAAAPPAWLGAALHDSALRERDPRELAAALEHSARQLAARPLRPGEALAVQAVFEAPPPLAGGLRVELVPATTPTRADAAPGGAAPEAAAAQATDASPEAALAGTAPAGGDPAAPSPAASDASP